MVVDVDAEGIIAVVLDNQRRIFVQAVNRSYNAVFDSERERIACRVSLNREGLFANRVNNISFAGHAGNGNGCVAVNVNRIGLSRNVGNNNILSAVRIFIVNRNKTNRVAAVVNLDSIAVSSCNSAFVDSDCASRKINFARAVNVSASNREYRSFSFLAEHAADSEDSELSLAAGYRSAGVASEYDRFNAVFKDNAGNVSNTVASRERAVRVRASNRRHFAVDEDCIFHTIGDSNYAVFAENYNASPDVGFIFKGIGVAAFFSNGISKEFSAVLNQANASLYVGIGFFSAVFGNREGFVKFDTCNGNCRAAFSRNVDAAFGSGNIFGANNDVVGSGFFVAEVEAYSAVSERGRAFSRRNAECSYCRVGYAVDSVSSRIAFFELSRFNRSRKVSQRENCAVCANFNRLKDAVAFLSTIERNRAVVAKFKVSNFNREFSVDNISIRRYVGQIERAVRVDNKDINPVICGIFSQVDSEIFFSGFLGRFENGKRGSGSREQTSRSSLVRVIVNLEAFVNRNIASAGNHAFSNGYVNSVAGNVGYSLTAGCIKAVGNDNRAVRERCRIISGGNNKRVASRSERNVINRRAASRGNFSLKRSVDIVNFARVNREILSINAIVLREGVLAGFFVSSQFRKVGVSGVGCICAEVSRSRRAAEVNHVVAFEELVVVNCAGKCKEVGVDFVFSVNVIDERRGRNFAIGISYTFSDDNLERFAVHSAGVGLAVVDEGFAGFKVGNAVYCAAGYVDDNAVAFVAAVYVGNSVAAGSFERGSDNNFTSFENCAGRLVFVGCVNRQAAFFAGFFVNSRREGYFVDSSRASRGNCRRKFSRNSEGIFNSRSVNCKVVNRLCIFAGVGSERVSCRRTFFIFGGGNIEACKVSISVVAFRFAVVSCSGYAVQRNRVVVANLYVVPGFVVFVENVGICVSVFDNSRAVNNNLFARADVDAAVEGNNCAVVQFANAVYNAVHNSNRDAVGIAFNHYSLAAAIGIGSRRVERINNRNSAVFQRRAVFGSSNRQSIVAGCCSEGNVINNDRFASGYEVSFKLRSDSGAEGTNRNLERGVAVNVFNRVAFVLREGVAFGLAAFFVERSFNLYEVSRLSIVFRNAVVSLHVRSVAVNRKCAVKNLVVRNFAGKREQVVIAFSRRVINIGVDNVAIAVGFGNDNFVVNELVGLAVELNGFFFNVETGNALDNASFRGFAFFVRCADNNRYAVARREFNRLAGGVVARIVRGCNFAACNFVACNKLNCTISKR